MGVESRPTQPHSCSRNVGRRPHSYVVSRSQTLYLEKQRGKGLVKLPWQISSDHTTIFEALNWIFETTMGNNLVFSAYSAPQEAS